AGIPALRAMRLEREDISPVEGVLVSRGVVGLDPLDQFELPDHPVTLDRIVAERLLRRRAFAPAMPAPALFFLRDVFPVGRRLVLELAVDAEAGLGSVLFLGLDHLAEQIGRFRPEAAFLLGLVL